MATDATSAPKGRSRPVIDPSGRYFPRVTDAAVDHGFSASHVWTSARLQRAGWRFADEPLRPPVVRPSRRGG